jgi:hypothetical protein
MFSLLFCAQLAGAITGDSTYTSPALRALVARAAIENLRPPSEFRSYNSRIETELSLLMRDTLGREHTASVEQIASAATWNRDGRYDIHIIGYRSQTIGVPYSTLSIIRGWTVPSLYGNRLSLGTYFGSNRRRGMDTLRAVHPFATDRERYYRFSGGDTVAVLRVGARSIPIARIHTHPAFTGPTSLGAFDGEIDIDAERAQIVRMRGRFVTVGGQPSVRSRFLRATTGAVAVAYAEFVNAEIAGKYWLPAFQRTEFQASFPIFGQTRPVFRLVSNIRNSAINESLEQVTDTTFRPRMVVSWAPSDSVSAFTDWERSLGAQSSSVHSDDFMDMAPDAWRSIGPPRINPFPTEMGRMLRFNRVEGAFTGVAPSIDFRSVVPGLTAGANIGWAWTEKTARGGAYVSYRRNTSIVGARVERSLATTNDFALPLSADPGFSALLGSIDNYDYVDRRTVTVSLTRVLGAVDVGLVTMQIGAGEDVAEVSRLTHGLFGRKNGFRINRGVAEGRYAMGSFEVELHPNVTGDFVQPGFGARLRYENASGDIDWQRAELMLSARRYAGPLSFGIHADGGVVLGSHPPPQTLFELGGNELLPGYEYKEFAGDRAALVRTFAGYRTNLWKRPIHFVRNLYLPAFNPGLAVSAQAGWTELSSSGAIAAVNRLGAIDGKPVSRATGGMRATVGGGITIFSDLIHIGVARPVDRPTPLRFVAGLGVAF